MTRKYASSFDWANATIAIEKKLPNLVGYRMDGFNPVKFGASAFVITVLTEDDAHAFELSSRMLNNGLWVSTLTHVRGGSVAASGSGADLVSSVYGLGMAGNPRRNTDEEIRRLERAVEADPENSESRRRYLAAQARTGDSVAKLELERMEDLDLIKNKDVVMAIELFDSCEPQEISTCNFGPIVSYYEKLESEGDSKKDELKALSRVVIRSAGEYIYDSCLKAIDNVITNEIHNSVVRYIGEDLITPLFGSSIEEICDEEANRNAAEPLSMLGDDEPDESIVARVAEFGDIVAVNGDSIVLKDGVWGPPENPPVGLVRMRGILSGGYGSQEAELYINRIGIILARSLGIEEDDNFNDCVYSWLFAYTSMPRIERRGCETGDFRFLWQSDEGYVSEYREPNSGGEPTTQNPSDRDIRRMRSMVDGDKLSYLDRLIKEGDVEAAKMARGIRRRLIPNTYALSIAREKAAGNIRKAEFLSKIAPGRRFMRFLSWSDLAKRLDIDLDDLNELSVDDIVEYNAIEFLHEKADELGIELDDDKDLEVSFDFPEIGFAIEQSVRDGVYNSILASLEDYVSRAVDLLNREANDGPDDVMQYAYRPGARHRRGLAVSFEVGRDADGTGGIWFKLYRPFLLARLSMLSGNDGYYEEEGNILDLDEVTAGMIIYTASRLADVLGERLKYHSSDQEDYINLPTYGELSKIFDENKYTFNQSSSESESE